jgi:xylulokinase
MPGQLLIGVDIGTQSSKGVLCAPDGTILASTTVQHDTSFPRPGWAEHDADAIWWTELAAICRQLLSGEYAGAEIGGVGVSAIGPCMVPLDAEGRPLRPAVLYGIDSRASKEIAWLENRYGERELYAFGGMPLSSQAVGPKIRWLRVHEPELFARTAMVHSASDYLVYRLTGEHVIDRHTASAFNPLIDIERLEWDDRFAGEIIDRERLPRLLDASEIAGRVTPAASAETGLPVGTPVTAGTIDVAAEALSAGVVDPGDMMLMYGSTFFLLNLVDAPRTDPRLWPAAYSLPDRRAIMGGMATSGLITKWFRDVIAGDERRVEDETGISVYQQLCDQAEAVPAGSEGVICLPYFAGERTPLHDPNARGMFAGLSLLHTRGHLYRAVLEGVGYGVRHHLEIMHELDAAPLRIVAVGGGTQSDLWAQIVSDIAGITQLIPARKIGASYGDAMLAGLAVGVIDSVEELADGWTRIARTVEPNPANAAVYDEGYGIYRDLYENTKGQLHALARMGNTPKALTSP